MRATLILTRSFWWIMLWGTALHQCCSTRAAWIASTATRRRLLIIGTRAGQKILDASVVSSNTGEICRHFSRRHSSGRRCMTAGTENDIRLHSSPQELLKNELEALGINYEELHNAALQSIESPTNGYDVRYGKSAIKCYRSFVYPRKTNQETNNVSAKAAASRCARQVDFLIKRHKSREAEWVRHTDTATSRQTFPLILVLDNVRSAFNVGSLFRTADACGCMQVVTTGITPHPNGSGADKLRKCALGADLVVPHLHFDTTRQAIQYLKGRGWELIGMETTEQSILYTNVEYPRANTSSSTTETGIALVLGNEVSGVDTEIIPLLDQVVEIPMFGAKNSLNIAACAPVVLYEILRQWEATKEDPPP